MEAQPPTTPRWRRGIALLVPTFALAVTGWVPLVAVPYALLAAAIGTRRLAAVLAMGFAVVMTFAVTAPDHLWYLERGWAILLAGCFVTATLLRPSSRFFGRALVAVIGTFAVVAAGLSLTPGSWDTVDFVVRQGLLDGVNAALEALRVLQGPEGEGPSHALVSTVVRTAERQGHVFPALLGLSSLAGLGTAWWLYVRLAWESDRGVGPLREFRFNDHLVWLFLLGLGLVALGLGDAWSRAGTNAVVFMGGLYALRGVAVVAFLSGGISMAGALIVSVALLLLWPVIVGGAVLIGLGDTWLDVRTHAEGSATGDG